MDLANVALATFCFIVGIVVGGLVGFSLKVAVGSGEVPTEHEVL